MLDRKFYKWFFLKGIKLYVKFNDYKSYIGCGNYFALNNGKAEFNPEIHIKFYNISRGFPLSVATHFEVSFTSKSFNPSVGILGLEVRYNFPYNKNNWSGITFGFNYNLNE